MVQLVGQTKRRNLQQMFADWQQLRRLGIQVMQGSTDGDSVVVLVPVADPHTLRTLKPRYGPVMVSSWLQRA